MTVGVALFGANDSNVNRHFVSGELLALCTLAATLLLLYFGLFNHDFSVDGLRYAADVDAGWPLFHPNHLLPSVLFRAIRDVAAAMVIVPVRSIWLLQSVNVVVAVATALCLCRALAAESGVLNAWLLGLLYGVGFAAWNFAEEPGVYVLPAFCVAASLVLLLRTPILLWRHVIALSLLAILAVLFLQQYVFWYPALLALLCRAPMGDSRRAKFQAVAIAVPVACLTVYVAIGAQLGALIDKPHALSWFFGYAYDAQQGFGTYRPPPPWSDRALDCLLGLGNLVFSYDILGSTVLVAFAVMGGAVLGGTILFSIRHLGRSGNKYTIARVMFVWTLANILFAAWWEARNIEFLFPAWLGVIVLVGLGARRMQPAVLAALVLAIAGVNLVASFWPQRDWPERYRTVAQLAVAEHLRPRDVLITEELNTVRYLAYFHDVDVRFMPGAVSAAMHASEPVSQARAALASALASGARVYTTELDEHGRLSRIAETFAVLGRAGFDGAIDRDIAELYRGYELVPTVVPGVRRILATPTAPLR